MVVICYCLSKCDCLEREHTSSQAYCKGVYVCIPVDCDIDTWLILNVVLPRLSKRFILCNKKQLEIFPNYKVNLIPYEYSLFGTRHFDEHC
jgi:hypothetical protein